MSASQIAVGRVLRAADPYRSRQGPVYTPAISAETVAATGLFFGMVTLSPGTRTTAHVHERHESAFYLISGEEVELWSGPELQHRDVARPGDFLYIPANVPHVAINRTRTPAVFIAARNDPTAQESVLMRPDLDARVPRSD